MGGWLEKFKKRHGERRFLGKVYRIDKKTITNRKNPRCFKRIKSTLYYKTFKNVWTTIFKDLLIAQATRHKSYRANRHGTTNLFIDNVNFKLIYLHSLIQSFVIKPLRK
jgi:hypothetical protein